MKKTLILLILTLGFAELATAGALARSRTGASWLSTCSSLSRDIENREVLKGTDNRSLDGLTAWDTSTFTDPKAHSDQKFTYLIHAVNSEDPSKLVSADLGNHRQKIFASLITDRTQANRLSERSSGFILSVKPDNVVGTSCVDTGYHFTAGPDSSLAEFKTDFKTYFQLYKMQTPKDLVLANLWSMHLNPSELADQYFYVVAKNNEILLRGVGANGNIVRVAGVFIGRNNPLNERIVNALKAFAQKERLPIVEFN